MAKRKFKRKLKERGTRLPDKYPCIDIENCGSSDAMSVYEHDDGTYSCHCFACHSQHLPKSAWLNIDLTTMTPVEPWGEDYDEDAEEEVEVAMGDFTVQEVIEDFEAASLSDRKLSKSTLEEYGCRVSYDDDGVINRHFYPAYDEGRQKGFRIRGRFEEYHKEVKKKPHLLGKLKNFSGRVGEVNGHLDMFGSWLFTPEKHKRLFITEGECFKGDVQVFTNEGWKRFDELTQDELVAQVNSDLTTTFVKPLAYIKKSYKGEMLKHTVKGFSHTSTPNHNMVSLDFNGNLYKHPANGVRSKSHTIPRVACMDGTGINLTNEQIALQIAVSADFKIDQRKTKHGYAHGGFKKGRKVCRIKELLKSLDIEFTFNESDSTGYSYVSFTLPDWIKSKKLPKDWLVQATLEQREFILDELVQWDGNVVKDRDQTEFSSKFKSEASWVQTMAHTCGKCSSIIKRSNEFGEWYKVSILHDKDTSSWQSMKTEKLYHDGEVYCVTVTSGMILIKDDDKITVTGNCDAMTGYQMSKMKTKNKQPYAFVSMPSGANVKGIRDNIRYINSFDEIYLCLDMDDAGNKLLEEALKILPVSKVRIMKVPKGFKDLNELWTHEDSKAWRDIALNAFWDAIWNSEKYCPAGVRSFSEGFEAMRNRDNVTKIPFPSSFGDLNELTYGGYAKGEITTIAAPSSVGKSIFTREMTYTAWSETEEKIGIIPLEDSYEEMMEMLCGVHLSEQINEIPYDKRDWDKIKKAHTELSEGNRIHIIDHQGAIDQDNLLEFIDFLVCGLGCGIVILDPITLALSKQETDEEEVLSEILRRVKRYKYAHVNVCHVRKNAGSSKANSEGGEISEEDIKGSGAYFQISMNNILLMRNKVHPNPIIKNTTKIKLSKCRRHGKSTGIAGYAYYNGETGRLERGTDPELLEQGYSEDDEVGFETN